MGILVPEAVLPMGIAVSNVYMSFSGEVVYIYPRDADKLYRVQSHYKMYKDQTRTPDTPIRIPIFINVTDISLGGYHYLYEKLKQSYPNSIDVIETEPTAVIPEVAAEIL